MFKRYVQMDIKREIRKVITNNYLQRKLLKEIWLARTEVRKRGSFEM